MLFLCPQARSATVRRGGRSWKALLIATLLPALARADGSALKDFTTDIQPVLDQYCYDCHGYGAKKGGVRLDDFASDAAIIGQRSGVLLEIDLDALPVQAGVGDRRLALTGGDDYELCVCVAAEQRDRVQAAVGGVSWIGRVLEGRGARFVDAGGERALAGYEHRLA